jgi:hypothetical protein
LKSEALAGRLDELGCDPAEALVRLGNKAEAAGDTELAIKAFTALPFRWPKLKETGLDIGLSGSLADRLQDAQARLTISVVTGVDRPPDDPIEAAPVPPSSPAPPPPEPPATQASPSPAASPPTPPLENPTPRPAAPPSPEPPLPRPGQPVKAHDYWTQRKPETPSAGTNTDYDPWKL